MERVEMASHTATRVDSPLHFIPKGKTLDDFSSDEFMREGVILNLSQRDNQITIDESKLREFDAEIQANDVVMLHTRWDQYYGRTPEYLFEFPPSLGRYITVPGRAGCESGRHRYAGRGWLGGRGACPRSVHGDSAGRIAPPAARKRRDPHRRTSKPQSSPRWPGLPTSVLLFPVTEFPRH